MSYEDNTKQLIKNYGLRLQKLKELQALEGRSVDPKILLEIDDIEVKIKELRIKSGVFSKRRVQIFLQGDFNELPTERWAAAIESFAAIMKIPPDKISIHRVI